MGYKFYDPKLKTLLCETKTTTLFNDIEFRGNNKFRESIKG